MYEEMQVSLEQLGDVDGSFRISPQENLSQYCEDRLLPRIGIAYAFSTLQTLVLHKMLLSQGLGGGKQGNSCFSKQRTRQDFKAARANSNKHIFLVIWITKAILKANLIFLPYYTNK